MQRSAANEVELQMGARTQSAADEHAPKAAQPRMAKRMTCALSVGSKRFSGLVLNVSQGGLFVQTAAAPERGTNVAVEINPPGDEAPIPVHAEVVWRRVVPQQLRSSAQGGMGVKIVRADEHYYTALAEWMRVSLDPGERVASDVLVEPPLAAYRVRVRAVGTPRTRSVSVEAASDDGAIDAAIRYLGDGWQILEVEPV